MKYFSLCGLLLLFGASLPAQDAKKAPEISFRVVENFFKMPRNVIMAEAVGVSINSKGHIFVLNRGNHPLLEFTADGEFVGSFGEDSPIFRVPHSIRFDSQDNLWYANAADNLVVKFDTNMQVAQALGRRDEPWVYLTHGIERAIPLPENFYQPTDAAVGPDGSTYVTDGYGNSRVVKFTKEGNFVKYWGDRGGKPGQFNTPHSIVLDAKSNLYVADRQNNRVQVFDTDGKFKDQWVLDGPAWSLCITPGPNQVIFVGGIGRVYKLDLNGKVLGEFGKFGKLPGWFDWIHSLACPDEKTLFLAQELSYRFDKIVLQ
jgi:DNA-binding beta-propeller fold protein YncE